MCSLSPVRFTVAFIATFCLIEICVDSRPQWDDPDEVRIYRNVHYHTPVPVANYIFMDNDGMRTDQCHNSSTRLAVFNYCHHYARCQDGVAIVTGCVENDVFNTKTGKCVGPKQFECKWKCKKEHNAVYIDHFDSNIFYACLGGKLESFECDPGTKFVLDKQECKNETTIETKKSHETITATKKSHEKTIATKKSHEKITATKKSHEKTIATKKSHEKTIATKKSHEKTIATKKSHEKINATKKSHEKTIATKKSNKTTIATKKSH